MVTLGTKRRDLRYADQVEQRLELHRAARRDASFWTTHQREALHSILTEAAPRVSHYQTADHQRVLSRPHPKVLLGTS